MTYKKPFKPSGLTDITMKSMNFYNLTSAWGCYKQDDDGNAGVDPDALYDTDNSVGCKGTWQSITNNLVYTDYVDGVETFVVASKRVGSDDVAIEGVLEAQITILLLDNAYKFAAGLLATATVFASSF